MHDLVLAATPHLTLAADGAAFFTDSTLGKALASLMKAVALIVVLVAAVKAIKDIMAGKAGKAASLIVGTVIVVAFLWDPTLITSVIDLGAKLFGQGVKDVDDMTNGGTGTGTGTGGAGGTR